MPAERLRLGRYQHYKGKKYRLIGVARHSEDHSKLFVVYKGLYTSREFGKNPIWVRPISIFFQTVIHEGKQVPRFKYLGR